MKRECEICRQVIEEDEPQAAIWTSERFGRHELLIDCVAALGRALHSVQERED